MTDKEKLEAIRAEIHRLVDVRGYDREMANDLFAFIDSLPEEPVSEDLEKAAEEYVNSTLVGSPYIKKNAYKAGAKWQKEQMMAKAINTEASFTMSVPSICISLPLGVSVGDKVKVIVIKEE